MKQNATDTNININWLTFCVSLLAQNNIDEKHLDLEDNQHDEFIQFTNWHGITPLLLDRLEQQSNQHVIAGDLRAKLDQIRRLAAIKEIYRKKHLGSVIHCLNENHINSLILKGTALAYSLYEQPFLRSRVDTDIFIHQKDKAQLNSVLIKLGLAKSLNNDGELISHQATYFQTDQNINHAYDIHWKLSNRNAYANSFSFDELYLRKQQLKYVTTPCYSISHVDALLHAIIHYFGHPGAHRGRLIWLYDLHLLLNQFSDESFQQTIYISNQKSLQPHCLEAFKIIQETFGTKIPQSFIDELTNSNFQISSIERKRIDSQSWTKVDQFKSDWMSLGNGQRIKLLKEHLFPSTTFMLSQNKSTHKMLLPYFYVKRIVLGVFKLLVRQ